MMRAVTKKIATILRTLGFDESCSFYYHKDGDIAVSCTSLRNSEVKNIIATPNVFEAKQWIKETFGYFIEVRYMKSLDDDWKYTVDVVELDKFEDDGYIVRHENPEGFETEEEAVCAGLLDTLKMIESSRRKEWKPKNGYVPFDVVELLEKKGFPVDKIDSWYDEYDRSESEERCISVNCYPLIPHSVVQDWFIEMHDIFVGVSRDITSRTENRYLWNIYSDSTGRISTHSGTGRTVEEAYENAFIYILENLI
jgi:hypothetical protein